STYFTRSVVMREPGPTAHRLVAHVQDSVLSQNGLPDWVGAGSSQPSSGSASPAKSLRFYLGQVYLYSERYLIAATYTLLVFLVRLLVLCLMVPLFLMAGFVGFVD